MALTFDTEQVLVEEVIAGKDYLLEGDKFWYCWTYIRAAADKLARHFTFRRSIAIWPSG